MRELCRSMNILSKGSKTDLIRGLKEHLQVPKEFLKIFSKFWGGSGNYNILNCQFGANLQSLHHACLCCILVIHVPIYSIATVVHDTKPWWCNGSTLAYLESKRTGFKSLLRLLCSRVHLEYYYF